MQLSGQCCRGGHRTRNELRIHNVDPRTCSVIGTTGCRLGPLVVTLGSARSAANPDVGSPYWIGGEEVGTRSYVRVRSVLRMSSTPRLREMSPGLASARYRRAVAHRGG